MLCFRDTDYCMSDCKNSKCDRMLSYSITKAAEKSGLPIAMSDYSKNCKDYKPKESQQ